MKNERKLLISVGILVVAVLVLMIASFAITKYTGFSVNSNSVAGDGFAKCLSDKGVKMYGASWCGHCKNNKAFFGNEGKILTELKIYIECDSNSENSQASLCSSKGIEGYPTWEINGKLYPGEQSLDKLAELSGCNLNG